MVVHVKVIALEKEKCVRLLKVRLAKTNEQRLMKGIEDKIFREASQEY